MRHLGERLSALVDGELGAAEHERALIHLAQCEPCRFEADMMRRLKRRLTGLGEPEPDMDFMGRLSSLSQETGTDPGGQGPSGPPAGGAGFGARPPLGSSRPIGGYPPGGPLAAGAVETAPERVPAPAHTDPSRPARRRGTDRFAHLLPPFSGGRYAVAGFAVATALIGSAFAAGGESAEEAPVVEPRLADYAVEHAVTSRQLPADIQPVGEEVTSGPTETTR